MRYNIAADIKTNRRKFGVKMNTNPFEDTTLWLDGSEMPQEAVDHIIRSIRLTFYTYTALILLPTILVTCVAVYGYMKDHNPIAFGTILFWLPGLHFLRSGIKHVRILKKRKFLWVEGVTGGIFAPKVKGEGLPGIFVRTNSSEIMIKNYPLHSTLGWKKEGVPVYSVMFNTYGRAFFKGGFFLDPIVFKKKR